MTHETESDVILYEKPRTVWDVAALTGVLLVALKPQEFESPEHVIAQCRVTLEDLHERFDLLSPSLPVLTVVSDLSRIARKAREKLRVTGTRAAREKVRRNMQVIRDTKYKLFALCQVR